MKPLSLLSTHTLPLVFVMTACASQGGDDGGSANLPGRGIAGWVASGEGPLFPTDPQSAASTEFGGPFIHVDGDEVAVWYHQKDGETFSLYRVLGTIPTSSEPLGFGPPQRVTVEGRDPSLIPDPNDPTRLLLAYSATDGLRIARGDGLVFEDLDVDLPSGASPSLVVVEGRLSLYALVDGVLTVSEATDTLVFTAPVPVLDAGSDCVDLSGESEPCWDGVLVDAEVRLAKTPTGRRLWRVFYAARPGSSGSTAIGFAASDDGLTFSRYAFNPVLDDTNMTAPASARIGLDYHLLVEERLGPGRAQIGLFTSTPDAPSDSF